MRVEEQMFQKRKSDLVYYSKASPANLHFGAEFSSSIDYLFEGERFSLDLNGYFYLKKTSK